MSYEHCETHDMEATNGCPRCASEKKGYLMTRLAISVASGTGGFVLSTPPTPPRMRRDSAFMVAVEAEIKAAEERLGRTMNTNPKTQVRTQYHRVIVVALTNGDVARYDDDDLANGWQHFCSTAGPSLEIGILHDQDGIGPLETIIYAPGEWKSVRIESDVIRGARRKP